MVYSMSVRKCSDILHHCVLKSAEFLVGKLGTTAATERFEVNGIHNYFSISVYIILSKQLALCV